MIRAEALRLQAELQQWEDGVQETRREGYFVNFFTLQQVGATSTDTDLSTGFISNGSRRTCRSGLSSRCSRVPVRKASAVPTIARSET